MTTEKTMRKVLLAVVVAVAVSGCVGLAPSEPDQSEQIAQIQSVSVEPVEDYCGLEYNISKQQGVMIQLKQGVTSQFEGNGAYHSELETQIDNWIVVSGGGKPIEINAYETPTNGTGKSVQIWKGKVTEDCSIATENNTVATTNKISDREAIESELKSRTNVDSVDVSETKDGFRTSLYINTTDMSRFGRVMRNSTLAISNLDNSRNVGNVSITIRWDAAEPRTANINQTMLEKHHSGEWSDDDLVFEVAKTMTPENTD